MTQNQNNQRIREARLGKVRGISINLAYTCFINSFFNKGSKLISSTCHISLQSLHLYKSMIKLCEANLFYTVSSGKFNDSSFNIILIPQIEEITFTLCWIRRKFNSEITSQIMMFRASRQEKWYPTFYMYYPLTTSHIPCWVNLSLTFLTLDSCGSNRCTADPASKSLKLYAISWGIFWVLHLSLESARVSPWIGLRSIMVKIWGKKEWRDLKVWKGVFLLISSNSWVPMAYSQGHWESGEVKPDPTQHGALCRGP